MRAGGAALVVALALSTAACAAGRAGPPGAAPTGVPTTTRTAALIDAAALAPCAPTSPPTGGAPANPPTGGAPANPPTGGAPAKSSKRRLPDVTLPCLVGGTPVRLAGLGQPAVVNLWASWCRACAAELPALAGLATALQGRVAFVGVDTADTADSALGTLAEAGVHYPSLYDRQSQVVNRLGLRGLPVTLLVRADGSVAYTKLGPLAGAAELRGLIGTYLGISG